MPLSYAYTTKGHFDTKSHANLARRRYLDDPDGPEPNEAPYYRVRLMPDACWPTCPYALLAFEWGEDADACDEMGEVH